MPARAVRWLAFACAALAVPVVVVLRPHPPDAAHGAVVAAAARSPLVVDAHRPPWYGMQLLRTSVHYDEVRPAATLPPGVQASAGILVDPDTGRVLWELDAHRRLPPASTVKLLTALVAMENFDLDRPVTTTADALFQRGDESKMGLHAGDTLTVRELLTAMLMVSANDAADVLAMDTVGMERFVGAMNAQALALGLRDTHVTSPVGLDDPQMYSSAHDLAALATVDADLFPDFDRMVGTHDTVLPASAEHPVFYLSNINLLLRMYAAATGIKTGYTGDAGACEVGMAVRQGHRLISVLLNGNLVYTQTRRLLDWGFVQEGLPTQLPTPTPSPSPSPRR